MSAYPFPSPMQAFSCDGCGTDIEPGQTWSIPDHDDPGVRLCLCDRCALAELVGSATSPNLINAFSFLRQKKEEDQVNTYEP